jgi:hypothetical protein
MDERPVHALAISSHLKLEGFDARDGRVSFVLLSTITVFEKACRSRPIVGGLFSASISSGYTVELC